MYLQSVIVVGNVISMFVYERASPMKNRNFVYFHNQLWHWDPEQIQVEDWSKPNYCELRMSTFVKLASACMVCLCDI